SGRLELLKPPHGPAKGLLDAPLEVDGGEPGHERQVLARHRRSVVGHKAPSEVLWAVGSDLDDRAPRAEHGCAVASGDEFAVSEAVVRVRHLDPVQVLPLAALVALVERVPVLDSQSVHASLPPRREGENPVTFVVRSNESPRPPRGRRGRGCQSANRASQAARTTSKGMMPRTVAAMSRSVFALEEATGSAT